MNCLKIEWSRNVLFAASGDYAENVMPHLRLHGNIMSLYRCWRNKNALLSAICRVGYLIPQT